MLFVQYSGPPEISTRLSLLKALVNSRHFGQVLFCVVLTVHFIVSLSQNQQMHKIINEYKMYFQPLHMFRQINCLIRMAVYSTVVHKFPKNLGAISKF
jgi:hypothetical protein